MDYLTRKHIAISTGAVGTWLGGRGYPHIRAIGVRVSPVGEFAATELAEAISDLDLVHHFPTGVGLHADDVEKILAQTGTPREQKQLARGFLLGLAQGAKLAR